MYNALWECSGPRKQTTLIFALWMKERPPHAEESCSKVHVQYDPLGFVATIIPS